MDLEWVSSMKPFFRLILGSSLCSFLGHWRWVVLQRFPERKLGNLNMAAGKQTNALSTIFFKHCLWHCCGCCPQWNIDFGHLFPFAWWQTFIWTYLGKPLMKRNQTFGEILQQFSRQNHTYMVWFRWKVENHTMCDPGDLICFGLVGLEFWPRRVKSASLSKYCFAA